MLITIFCFPAVDHLNPLLRLAETLTARGNRVQIMSSAGARQYIANNLINKSGLVDAESTNAFSSPENETAPPDKNSFIEFIPLYDELLPEHEHPHLGLSLKRRRNDQKFAAVAEDMSEAAQTYISNNWGKDSDSNNRPDLVVVDFLSFAGGSIAQQYGIEYTVYISLPLQALEKLGVIPCLSLKDQLSLMYRNSKHNCSLTKNTAAHIRDLCDNRLLLINSCYGIEPPRALAPRFKIVGRPLPSSSGKSRPQLPPDIEAFLSVQSASVIYVSFGSRMSPSPEELEELYYALKRGKWGVIWSIKQKDRELLPEVDIPSQFCLRPWFHQKAVLNHPKVQAMVTHCGFGGMTEALEAAVPMLALPQGAIDQFDNAGIIERKKFGIKLVGRQRSREKIFKALTSLLFKSTFKKSVGRGRKAVLAESMGDRAALYIEAAAKYGVGHLVKNVQERNKGVLVSSAVLSGFVLGGLCSYFAFAVYSPNFKFKFGGR